MMNYVELDAETRKWMLVEFDEEQNRPHYQSDRLNSSGLAAFPNLMRQAIQTGTEDSLIQSLSDPSYWKSSIPVKKRGGGMTTRTLNSITESKMLGHSEFNTLYTRGFARRLIEEKIEECEIYRGDMAMVPNCECTKLEGSVQPVGKIYDGHRKKYFPTIDPTAFSIPSSPFCHHTIKRKSV